MKTLILLLLISLSFSVKSQSVYDKYTSNYFATDYIIGVSSAKESANPKMYIGIQSLDKAYEVAGLILPRLQQQQFIYSLLIAKDKFIEWNLTASQNNIVEFSKEMDINFTCVSYFKFINDWYFDFDTKLIYEFRVINSESYLIIRTGLLEGTEFACEDAAIVFKDAIEISTFLNKISYSNFDKALESVTRENLFK